MPVAEKITAFFDRLNKERNSHSVDWVFEFVANPDSFFLLDPVWEYLGRKEVEPALKAWLDLEMQAEIISPISIDLGAFSPQTHTAAVTISSKTAKPAAPNLSKDLTFRFNLYLDDHLKFTRIIIQAGDEHTRNWQLQVLAAVDREHGVPEGEFKEAKEKFVQVIQAVPRGCKAIGELVSEEVEYVDPMGSVVFGKHAFTSKLDEWYSNGLTDALEPTEIYTPAPNKARAPVVFVFGKLPEDCPISKHAPFTDLTLTFNNDGKIDRIVSVPFNDEGRAWDREFAKWVLGHSKGVGAA